MNQSDADQLLVERVKRGDKRAFDMLVAKYQHKIMALVARYLNNPSDVMDVAQEAFIKAYRALPNFRGDSAFYTWLYRIAVNTAKNHIVAASRRPLSADLELTDAEQMDAAPGLKNTASPENELISKELENLIFSTIAQLPEELKVAISLRELDGLSYEEISEIMQCPVGTVRSRIFRAREAIDRELSPMLKENT